VTVQLFHEELPDGLILVDGYLDQSTQDECIELIDGHDWGNDLQRRTQHYGSRYDYATGRAAGQGTAPSPPDLFVEISQRLSDDGYFERPPDQIIVNEYVVDGDTVQGIGPHRDRTDCFGPAIATISLVEAWAMRFSHERHDHIDVLLATGSLALMTGAVRYDWQHSIPPRRFERTQNLKVPRRRRVSLTFRSLLVD